MRAFFAACALTAVALLPSAPAQARASSIVFEGHCAPNSRVGSGNVFQNQWELSHRLARPFRCDSVMIAAQSGNVVWITFYSAAGVHTQARMVFIGGKSSPTAREFDVIGGQAFYGVPGPSNRYAWAGQVTCSIHMRTHYIETAQKIVCTAIVNRGSDEKILAVVFLRANH